MKGHSCVIIFYLSFISVCSLAQTRNYRHYSVENGLASSTAYMACEDEQGYLWFATDGGVSRFDGKKFITYTIDDGLSDNEVLRVYRDSKNRVWFLTFNGHLSYFLDGQIHNESTDPFLRNCYIGTPLLYFFEDSKKRLWIGGYNNIVTLVEGTKCTRIRVSKDLQQPDIGMDVEEKRDGTILLYYFTHQYAFDEQLRRFHPIQSIDTAGRASYRKAAQGVMYYFTDEGIIRTEDGATNIVYTFDKNQLISDDLITINDYDRHLYLSTWKKGVVCLDHTMKFNEHTVCYLPEKIVNWVHMDHEKNLWFMTLGDGIYVLPAQSRNALIYNEQLLNNEHVYSVSVNADSSIWVGGGESLCLVKGSNIENYYFDRQTGNINRILAIEKDRENMSWVLSDQSPYKVINDKPFQVKKVTGKNVISLGKGLSLTFNSKNNGFFVYPYQTATITENHHSNFKTIVSPANTYIRNFCGFYDVEDRLYIADINGLSEIIAGKRHPIDPTNALLRSRISTISQASDSTLVLGTDGNGVLFVKNKKLTGHLTVNDGLPSNSCRKIKLSGEKIFVCTNNGLCHFIYHRQQVSEMRTYSILDGLASNDVRDVDISGNKIIAATIKGLSIIEPSPVQDQSAPPYLFINEVKNNNVKVPWNAAFTINHHNNLSISFNAVTFSDPDRTVYQYSLTKDEDTNWVVTAQNEISLPGLAPGNYSFILKAKKSDSQWSLPLSFSFRVTPPFYKTWWFTLIALLLVLAFFGLLAFYLYRIRMRKYLSTIEKNEVLNLERMRISSDMHDDLGSDFSKIAVITELIKIALSNNRDSQFMAQRISEYVHNSRKKMDEIIWALNPNNDSTGNLVSYCNAFTLNFFEGSSIRVHIDTPQDLPELQLNAMQRRNLFLVIKEITNNALKHSGATNFFLYSKISGQRLIISAKDDGRGFEMNGIKKNGLNNINKRIKEINGEITVQSKAGEGTEFIIEMMTTKQIVL